MGLSPHQIPKGRVKVRSVVWHLMDCGYTIYISLSRAYTVTYCGIIYSIRGISTPSMATESKGLLLVRVLKSSHVMKHDTECLTDLPSHYIALMALNVARYNFLSLQRR